MNAGSPEVDAGGNTAAPKKIAGMAKMLVAGSDTYEIF